MIERLRFEPLAEGHAQLLFTELGGSAALQIHPQRAAMLACFATSATVFGIDQKDLAAHMDAEYQSLSRLSNQGKRNVHDATCSSIASYVVAPGGEIAIVVRSKGGGE